MTSHETTLRKRKELLTETKKSKNKNSTKNESLSKYDETSKSSVDKNLRDLVNGDEDEKEKILRKKIKEKMTIVHSRLGVSFQLSSNKFYSLSTHHTTFTGRSYQPISRIIKI